MLKLERLKKNISVEMHDFMDLGNEIKLMEVETFFCIKFESADQNWSNPTLPREDRYNIINLYH